MPKYNTRKNGKYYLEESVVALRCCSVMKVFELRNFRAMSLENVWWKKTADADYTEESAGHLIYFSLWRRCLKTRKKNWNAQEKKEPIKLKND